MKLPPQAFAIGPDREPEPSDLIDNDTWGSLTCLPDDVSLRTSDHHGGLLKHAYDTWVGWVDLILDVQSLTSDPREDALALACLNVGDELQASIYLALTGFYRQGVAALRSALEGVVVGCHFRAVPDPKGFADWAGGRREGRKQFQQMRHRLAGIPPYLAFEHADGVFPSLMGNRGWVDFLYGFTSGFSHGRPFFVNPFGDRVPTSNVELWGGSNGPVYEPRSVRLWSNLYFDTALACLELAGLADVRLVGLSKTTGKPYLAYVERVLGWHPAPPDLARRVAGYLCDSVRQG